MPICYLRDLSTKEDIFNCMCVDVKQQLRVLHYDLYIKDCCQIIHHCCVKCQSSLSLYSKIVFQV